METFTTFLKCAIGKMTSQGLNFSEAAHSSMVLQSLIFDILLTQFFSLEKEQQVTSVNIPMGEFHLKTFTEVTLDVILTELNKVVEENMEDLLIYERATEEERKLKYVNRSS
ncbi:uncharacterized protein LOC144584149 isoform X2 [Pogona vitticeps]